MGRLRRQQGVVHGSLEFIGVLNFAGQFEAWDRAVPAFIPSLRRYPGAVDQRWSWKTFLGNHELPMDILILALFSLVSLPDSLLPWR